MYNQDVGLCGTWHTPFRRHRLGADHFGTGTCRRRTFRHGPGRWQSLTLSTPLSVWYAHTADVTTRNEQRLKEKRSICKPVPLTQLLILTPPIPYVPTYISYSSVPLSTAAIAAVAGQRRALGGGRRIHGGSMREEGWGWEWQACLVWYRYAVPA